MLGDRRQDSQRKVGYPSRTLAEAETKCDRGAQVSKTTVRRRVLAVSLWIQSGEGCSLSIDETIGRRLNVPLDTLGRRVLTAHRRNTGPKAGYHGRTPAEAEREEIERGARVSTTIVKRRVLGAPHWIHSGEGCPLPIDETIGRRLNVPMNILKRRVLAVHRRNTGPKAGYTSRASAMSKLITEGRKGFDGDIQVKGSQRFRRGQSGEWCSLF